MSFPILHIQLPRHVTAIHQIEITSRCNLACVYCTSPQIMAATTAYKRNSLGKTPPDRPAMDMDETTFRAALQLARHFVQQGTQRELNLAGIGESTLHPRFVEYVALAREAVGAHVKLIFATNGLIASDELARALKPYYPEVWVSLHRPEKAGLAVEIYRRHKLFGGISIDPSVNANDWAGQVAWHRSGEPLPCMWLREGKAFVLADGRISTCCLDAQASGVIGTVHEPPGDLLTRPYALCRACHQEIDIAGYDQRGPG